MKKILIIILIAFIVVSLFSIIFTFQASSIFINFTDDDGDNGDDNFRISNLNISHNNCDDTYKELNIYSKKQNTAINKYKLSNSIVFTIRQEKISIGEKLQSK